jgi:formylglycine-generating enzyme required for sulfatase activity
MTARYRERLTFSNVVSVISLLFALGLGTAWAATELGRNEVKSKHIKNAGVKTKDLANNSVTSPKVADGSLQDQDFAPGQLPQGPQGPQGEPGPSSFAANCSEGLAANDVMVRVGSVCIDKYEASVWSEPNGGIQYGVGAADDYPCDDNGQDCTNIYARSIPGVKPSANITYFQAQQALANAGKRLPTNAEWQTAVAGTPDPGTDNDTTDCNVTEDGFPASDPVNTGSRPACVSRFGAFDMVGNVAEWVADWDEEAGVCGTWPAAYGSDFTCYGDPTPSGFPGTPVRGGDFGSFGAGAGPFAVNSGRPSSSLIWWGFRGAR